MLQVVLFGCLLAGNVFVHAATTTVMASGTCPADPAAVQNAINNAAPGDTIQLLPGPSALPFNFTCFSNGVVITIQIPALSIQGSPGADPTILQGPGVPAGENGFLIFSDQVTVTGIDFRGFAGAITVTNPSFDANQTGPANVSITHSRFENNALGTLLLGVGDHFRFTNNVLNVPPPISAAAGASVGIAVLTRDNDVLIADNQIVGPGASGLVTSLQQFLEGNSASEQALFQTIGIQQIEISNPASIRGRISGNVLTGLDLGLQSSSNFGVVTQNTTTNCEIGMTLSNDIDDGVSQVTDSLVSLNTSTHNEIGFAVFSGSRNTIALNDFSENNLAGLFFVANPSGAPSVGNSYGCNHGTVKNAEGNRVVAHCPGAFPVRQEERLEAVQ
jgi:hypothetical protein